MSTVAIIQARLGSTRFPGKVLAPLCGRPIIQHVIERAHAISGVDQVVVAMPHRDAEVLGSALDAMGVAWAAPDVPEEDVLARYRQVVEELEADSVVRVTADCPLLDPEIAGVVLAEHQRGLTDLTSNVDHTQQPPASAFTFPPGLDVEVFSSVALDRAYLLATEPVDRRHVTLIMYRRAKDIF